jgi:uncharacterized membrane protein
MTKRKKSPSTSTSQPTDALIPKAAQALKDVPPELVERLSQLPPEVLKAFAKNSGAVHIQESYQGDYPHPRILAGYEELWPGAAEAILRGVREQQAHRHRLENHIIKRDTWLAGAGMACGLVAVFAVLALGGYAMNLGHPWPGALLSAAGLGGLVAAFMGGKQINQSLRSQKNGETKRGK